MMRRKSGWFAKRMPNRSNTSRSYQSAERHTEVTESISGCSPRSRHFSRSRWLALDRMQMIDHLEARLGRIAVHRRDRAQPDEFPVVLQEAADAGNLGRRDLQRQLAAVVLAAGHRVGIERLHGRGHGMLSQIVG